MIESIIQMHRAFFQSGKTLDVSFRKRALKELKRNIENDSDRIAEALYTDLGKSSTESYMCEIGLALNELSHCIRNIGKWSKPQRVGTPLAQFPARSHIIREPYGNVLIMSPWNYPFLLCISPLIYAVAAGNTAIIKPSAYAPATSSVVASLIARTFSEEHVAVMEGGRDVNTSLLEQKFDYIFFTGSKTVGKLVMGKAATHLTPVTLELGGKSPVIVDKTARIKTAAARIVFGKFLNCGQTCVAPDYIMVDEEIADEFINECIAQIKAMFGDNPLSGPDYGRIINRKHFDRLINAISECPLSTNAQIVLGGGYDPDLRKIEPTIVTLGTLEGLASPTSKESRMAIVSDEIFGPIMPVITYKNLTEVIKYVDNRPRPLAAYIFTESPSFKKHALERLHFGGGCVNDTIIHLASNTLPFGGLGDSGMGNYHGKFGFDTFSHCKSIVDKPTWLDLPMRYQPYNSFKDKLIHWFLK